MYLVLVGFFLFKQKTAYEMRISDWSSDVCSSDLLEAALKAGAGALEALDPPTAEKHYGIASSLKPGTPEIEAALNRAKKLPEALQHLRAGAAAEQADRKSVV